MPQITELAAAAAVLALAKMAFDFHSRERDRDRAERAEDRKVWENHLSTTVAALVSLRDEQKRQGDEAREHYKGRGA